MPGSSTGGRFWQRCAETIGRIWAPGALDDADNLLGKPLPDRIDESGGAVGMDMEYEFPGAGNNGRITWQRDKLPGGEEVEYQYDELNRLNSAVTRGPEWGLTFTYDGFGNRVSQTKVESKQAGPTSYLLYNAANNRVVGWSYDANGNATGTSGPMQMEYDGHNRMVRAVNVQGGGEERYGYDPDNRRVYRRLPNGEEQLTFYDAFGRRLETWRYVASGWPRWEMVSENVYFAGRLIASGGQAVAVDRLGSIRARAEMQMYTAVWVERHKYYPYGEENPATVSNREKFATYHREQSTNLDYAMNRYYGWQHGRFLTPDPYKGSSRKRKPLSWNRYVYAQNDPVNFRDPRGLFREDVDYEEADDYDSFFDFWDIPGDDDPGERTERGMGDRPAQEDGGGPTPTARHIKLNSHLRGKTADALRNLSSECQNALANAGINLSKVAQIASSTEYYSAEFEGGYRVRDISGYVNPDEPGQDLASYLGSARAATLPNLAGTGASNIVVVGPKFFGQPILWLNLTSSQSVTLVHEALHTGTGLNDPQLAERLGFGSGLSVSAASNSISIWLAANCPPVNP